MNSSLSEVVRCVLILAGVGVGMWIINTKVPMDSTIKTIINVVVCFAALVWMLRFFGVL